MRTVSAPSAALAVAAVVLAPSDAFVPSSRTYQPSSAASSPLFRSIKHVDTCMFESSSASSASSASASSSAGTTLGAWIPLGSASSLSGLTPVQIKVCGLDLAVWHKPLPAKSKPSAVPTEWSALVDACPHRLAPLSQGRVDPSSGCIECPYHGWQYATDGALMDLPQLDKGRTIQAATGGNGDATSLPVHQAGDLLFVFIPTDVCGESWPIDMLPEDMYPYLADSIEKGVTYYTRDLPYSFDFLVENFMDPAHIPFAHHSLQGTRDDGSPIEMTVAANNFTHVETTFVDICRGKQRDGVLSFQRPALYHFRTRPNATAEYKPNLMIYTAPISAGMCRVIFSDIPIPFLPTFLGHAGSNRFLNTDTWLHDAERLARIDTDLVNKLGGTVAVGSARGGKEASMGGLNYIQASKADLGPATFRKWMSQYGFADAPKHSFGPANPADLPSRPMSREEQIDPWQHHAKHCSKCQKALKRLKSGQRLSVVVAAIGAILLKNKPPLAVAGLLAGFWISNFLRKLATAFEGNTSRSEIGYRSVAATALDKKLDKEPKRV